MNSIWSLVEPVILLILLIAWFACATAVGQYARRRGRDSRDWTRIALLISPPVAFFIVALCDVQTRAYSGLKKCPMCAEVIKAEAKICRFCRTEVVHQAAYREGPKPTPEQDTEGISKVRRPQSMNRSILGLEADQEPTESTAQATGDGTVTAEQNPVENAAETANSDRPQKAKDSVKDSKNETLEAKFPDTEQKAPAEAKAKEETAAKGLEAVRAAIVAEAARNPPEAKPHLGKYVHQRTGIHFIELRRDGECLVSEGPANITGRYEINGAAITIFGAGSTSRGQIRDNVIIDAEGDKWVRAKATEGATTNYPKCHNCNLDIPEVGARFCSNCGAAVRATG
jgi:hypothetical protein